MKIHLVSLLLLVFAGCEGSLLHTASLSPEELALVSDEQLCKAYAYKHSDKLRSEIESRQLFSEDEWQAIEKQSIFVGMSELAMKASISGLIFDGMLSDARGTLYRWRMLGTSVRAYIYTADGKVVTYEMF